ncbi:MAG: hypothetical protein WA688_00675 [Thermoplasmata archaeon]
MQSRLDRGGNCHPSQPRPFVEGRPYAPWLRLHYPNHYFCDILVGLDVLTRLGFGGDRRLRPPLTILKKKRRGDGTWSIDRSHPDLGAGVSSHPPKNMMKSLVIEEPGKPSKWITLTTLRVSRRVEAAR